ncbi:MAG: hypothetical protein ACE5JZ_06575 [Kiloniellales bacterium]
MPTAFSILPDRFADGRHEAIEAGLEACGYCIERRPGSLSGPGDVLVTWTVHRGHKELAARRFEAEGGQVVVCEEAYFRRVNREKHFALALHDHNGAGRWPVGGPERWQRFGIELKPWRRDGRHVLVREQRGIGSTKMASPPDWHLATAERLRAVTGRPIVIRWHPKSRAEPEKARAQPPLAQALEGCWAVVTWASAIAAAALVAGVPVFVEAPHHVLEGAVNGGIEVIDRPAYPDRLPAFRRLAWAQWSIAEIEGGQAFERLLRMR